MSVVVPIRPKETKLERFARMEALRLADRCDPTGCHGCGYRLTSHRSGLCRVCRARHPEAAEL